VYVAQHHGVWAFYPVFVNLSDDQKSKPRMNLKKLLADNRSTIVDRWHDIALQTYPEESQAFFKRKDRFGNPVGHTLSEGLEAAYDALLDNAGNEVLSKALDGIIRIRAIQEFTPSRAVRFLFGLKTVIRETLGQKLREGTLSEEWVDFEAEIDHMALLGFDVYSACRQNIYDIRVESVKRHTSRLLKKAGLVYEFPGDSSDQSEVLQEGIADLDNG